jgi:serine/threonine protein kinase
MEVVESSEAFEDFEGELVFSHTKIILRRQSEFFYALTKQRCHHAADFDLSTIECKPIPLSQIKPLFPAAFTRVTEQMLVNCYVKRPSLMYYGDTEASSNPGALLLQEAGVCEFLRSHPHPNIAKYLGCLVEEDRIEGLCFVRYGSSLLHMVNSGLEFDREACLQAIKTGIEHLHALHLIHSDITPSNVFGHGDSFVIGDFDSCTTEGNELGLKAGTKGWTMESLHFASREADWYGFSKIEEFLHAKGTANS